MKAVTPEVNLPQLEREVLAIWDEKKTFERSNERHKGKKEFTFYDGPPFANGLPHYGHLLANTIKDTVPRYWNMRGYYVERRFGWDCHGVPVEYEIEKREGIKGKADIMRIGVAQFNDMCRTSVTHYTGEWKKTITRLGRWVDWNNQYRTMDRSFMESVWWVLGELHKKQLLYRDFKVVPYSPRITAVLSNFEANQNYKTVQDPAITVRFKLSDEDAWVLAWTTTPWTLISNVALCAGPEIIYVKIRDRESGAIYYLAKSRLAALYKKGPGRKETSTEPFEILQELPGKDLAGRTYEPLFPYFKHHKNAFKILIDAYVSDDDGTGIVHQAPAFGEDDFRVGRANGIELVDPTDEEGRFKAEIPEHQGVFVKDADKDIIKRLKESGALVRHDVLEHSYPFCERTDTPLIYKAVATWYVAVEKIKDLLVANNQTINWVPDHLRDGRMGKWLEGARDWAISRNRYWGTPLPIWVASGDESYYEVITSVAELEKKCGQKVDDLHMEHIDKLTWQAPDGKGTMRRVPEVFDCWFESGSMPYAQNHYPFENKDRLVRNFPADFIAEGLDQTRGWFYTLAVLSAALFGKPAFKNVIVNGMVLAADGKKMSKRLRNYTAPDELLERFGADSVRLFMLNSAVLKAGDLCFSDQGVRDTTRAVILPLWNAYSFLSTYTAIEGWRPSPALARGEVPTVNNELDRWIISRFQTLCRRVHAQMELYRLYAVVPQVLDFIEDLTNWYIRLSRRRFWGTAAQDDESDGSSSAIISQEDSIQAYSTLYYVLQGFCKVFAPFAPFVSERIYQNMIDGQIAAQDLPDSVHLCDIPLGDERLIDEELEERMALLRTIVSMGRGLRAKHQIKTRQALPSMLVITRRSEDQERILRGQNILKSELNIKEISFSTDEARYVALSLKPNLKNLGPRLGKGLAAFKTYLEKLSIDEVHTLLAKLDRDTKITVNEQELTEADFLINRGPKDERLIASERGVTILLDTTLNEALIHEGLAREIINRIQKLRKESGLKVADRIRLEIRATTHLAHAAQVHRDHIARETLADKIDVLAPGEATLRYSSTYDIDGNSLTIGLE